MRKRRPNGKCNKTDLALTIHELLEIPLDPVTKTPREGMKLVEIILKTMKDALLRKETITIPGFGVFEVKTKRYYVPKPGIFNPGEFGHEHTIFSDEPQYFVRNYAHFRPSLRFTAMLNVENLSPQELRTIGKK